MAFQTASGYGNLPNGNFSSVIYSKKAAASTITKGTRASIDDKGTSGQIKESDVARMSTKEFEERQDEIAEAMKKGKFIYDVSK